MLKSSEKSKVPMKYYTTRISVISMINMEWKVLKVELVLPQLRVVVRLQHQISSLRCLPREVLAEVVILLHLLRNRRRSTRSRIKKDSLKLSYHMFTKVGCSLNLSLIGKSFVKLVKVLEPAMANP